MSYQAQAARSAKLKEKSREMQKLNQEVKNKAGSGSKFKSGGPRSRDSDLN